MKTLFIFRSSFDAQYILSKLRQKKSVQSVILETGEKAKYRKLKRLFQKSTLLQYPSIFINVLALVLYSSYMEKEMEKRLKVVSHPKNKISLIVKDANDTECIQFVQRYKPDIIFIYGTAILSKEFIHKTNSTIINIHSGILPYYRNVHSDFWAYMRKDYKKIGISLFFLDAGIDSGDVCLQKHIPYSENDRLIDIKVKNLSMIPGLIEVAIKKFKNKTLPRIKQDNSSAGFYPTPSFTDLVILFFRENFKCIN